MGETLSTCQTQAWPSGQMGQMGLCVGNGEQRPARGEGGCGVGRGWLPAEMGGDWSLAERDAGEGWSLETLL